MSEKFIYRRSAKVRWTFVLSLLLGLVLDSLLLSLQLVPVFPSFSLLITLYWTGHFLDRSYITTAFMMGLFTDTLLQSPLGAHALLFITLVYSMTRHRLHFSSFTYWQQAIYIVGYMLIYQIASYLFFNPALNELETIYFWFMPLFSGFCWLLIAPILNKSSLQIEQN